ncbi:MAG: hypothetical protein ACYC5O_22210 [Anaerolineae bacterium]
MLIRTRQAEAVLPPHSWASVPWLDIRAALESLALGMEQQCRLATTLLEARDLPGIDARTIAPILEMAAWVRLLRHSGLDADPIEFAHPLLQSYFAGEALATALASGRTYASVLDPILARSADESEHWQVLLPILSELLPSPSDLVTWLCDRAEQGQPQLALVAADCAQDGVSYGLAHRVTRLLEPLLAAPPPDRFDGSVRVLTALARNVKGEGWRVVARAMHEDGLAETVRFFGPLVLGSVPVEEAVSSLVSDVHDSSLPVREREMAVMGLGRAGNGDVLASMIANASLPIRVRAEAARMLGMAARSAAVESLFAILRDDGQAAGIRCKAAAGLVFAGHGADDVPERLAVVLDDPRVPESVRSAVAEALGGTHSGDALRVLSAFVVDRRSPVGVMRGAAFGMAVLSYAFPEAMQRLVDVVADASAQPGARRLAAAAIGQLGSPGPSEVAVLVRVATDASESLGVREGALGGLGGYGVRHHDARQTLARIATDSTERCRLRAQAVVGLGHNCYGEPGASEALGGVCADGLAPAGLRRLAEGWQERPGEMYTLERGDTG